MLNIRTINVFLESLLLEYFPSLGITVDLTSLGCPPTLYWLLSGLALGAAQILIWSYSSVFLPPMSTAIRTSVFSFVGALNTFYIFQIQRLSSWSYGFNLQLVQLVGRFWVFFLHHTAPRLQLWFYFHLGMWVIHWGLLLRLHWRTWVCPCEGQVWRWCSCLGCRGSVSIRHTRQLVARVAENIVLKKGMANIIYQYAPVFLPGETLSLTE